MNFNCFCLCFLLGAWHFWQLGGGNEFTLITLPMQLVRQLDAINELLGSLRSVRIVLDLTRNSFIFLLSFSFFIFFICWSVWQLLCVLFFFGFVFAAAAATSTVYSVGSNAGKLLARHENCFSFWFCDNLRKSKWKKRKNADRYWNSSARCLRNGISMCACVYVFVCGCFRGLQTRCGMLAIFGFLSMIVFFMILRRIEQTLCLCWLATLWLKRLLRDSHVFIQSAACRAYALFVALALSRTLALPLSLALRLSLALFLFRLH